MVLVSTAAFHARVRGSVPGLGGLKETKMFLPHPRVKVSIVGSLRDREVACSASDRQGSNFESCVWRTVSSQSSHHPQEVLLAQFSLYVHKGGLKPDTFFFSFALYQWLTQYRQRTKSVEPMLSGGHRQHLIVGAELTQLLLNHVDIGPASAPHAFSWGLMHETASLPRDQVQPVFIWWGHSTIKVQYVSQRCLQAMRLTLTKCAAFMCQHQNNRGYMVILKVALTEVVSGMFTHNHSHTQYWNLR